MESVATMRLQKYISAAGFCSRRRGEEYILAGHVKVNGVLVTTLGTKVDPEKDQVEIDGTPIEMNQTPMYIAMNKPEGYITTCRRNFRDERIVMDLIDIPQRVYPIGRLDRDSSGLLLLTNDGRLHHRLSHPSFSHEKAYEVRVDRPMSNGALRHMAKGLPMMGSKTRPATLEKTGDRTFSIILREGRNRQIRRMVRKVGGRVLRLKRIRVSNIRLGRLAAGNWRHLTDNERDVLLEIGIAPIAG